MPYAFVSIGQSNMRRAEPFLELALKDAYGPATRLCRCAVRGTNIRTDWQPSGNPFEMAALEINVALMEGYSIGAILCNQGEADTLSQGAGANWGIYYDNTLAKLWEYIGEERPAIHSALGQPPDGEIDGNNQPINRPKWMDVFKAQRDFGKPHIGQWDIPRLPHNVHYALDTYRDFQVPRYMAQLLKLVPVGV